MNRLDPTGEKRKEYINSKGINFGSSNPGRIPHPMEWYRRDKAMRIGPSFEEFLLEKYPETDFGQGKPIGPGKFEPVVGKKKEVIKEKSRIDTTQRRSDYVPQPRTLTPRQAFQPSEPIQEDRPLVSLPRDPKTGNPLQPERRLKFERPKGLPTREEISVGKEVKPDILPDTKSSGDIYSAKEIVVRDKLFSKAEIQKEQKAMEEEERRSESETMKEESRMRDSESGEVNVGGEINVGEEKEIQRPMREERPIRRERSIRRERPIRETVRREEIPVRDITRRERPMRREEPRDFTRQRSRMEGGRRGRSREERAAFRDRYVSTLR